MEPKRRKDILENCLHLSNQTKNYVTYIVPLIEQGILQLTIKNRPHSPHQKYFITNKGKLILYLCQEISNK